MIDHYFDIELEGDGYIDKRPRRRYRFKMASGGNGITDIKLFIPRGAIQDCLDIIQLQLENELYKYDEQYIVIRLGIAETVPLKPVDEG